MTGSNTDNTTSLSSTTDALEPSSSLSSDIGQIFQLLGHDVPDDVADQDVGTLLRQLERAHTIGQNVEDRIDAVLGQLDHLLSTLQRDGRSHTVDVLDGEAAPQPEELDRGTER
ncbi:hypothetical protein F5148DRAFT_1281534 [Russula earlei]|uniref:Uncharacterized protein n=1 Tax=Russula earlei TaxID=71964 RepID=A0ACC0UHH3_9AGAM|nr:hypothetical protein F5148DRAFT_1281534 [Russula earlei]